MIPESSAPTAHSRCPQLLLQTLPHLHVPPWLLSNPFRPFSYCDTQNCTKFLSHPSTETTSGTPGPGQKGGIAEIQARMEEQSLAGGHWRGRSGAREAAQARGELWAGGTNQK